MPIHLPPMTRRELLKKTIAAGAGLVSIRHDRGDSSNRWSLISDTHIGPSRETVVRGVCMAEHLNRVAAEIVSRDAKPGGILLNGDCALLDGQPADYKLLTKLAEPIRKAGIPLHMTLGNHDHRENFWAAIRSASPKALQSKHVTVLETPLANWFLLDSLDKVNVTPGLLGDEQLKWLGRALDDRPNKPALVFGHHHINFATTTPIGGLIDSAALVEVLKPRKQVKAYIFGHTHHWELAQLDGIHLINLPPVAYVFQPKDPSGWVDVELKPSGAALTLQALDSAHSAHGKKHELTWRT